MRFRSPSSWSPTSSAYRKTTETSSGRSSWTRSAPRRCRTRRWSTSTSSSPPTSRTATYPESPIKGEFHLARVPVTIGGVDFPAATTVFVMNGAANRDPRQFENPHEFRLDRANGRMHIAFGHGIHSCAGAPLARGDPHHHRALPRPYRRHPDLGGGARAGRRPALRVRPHVHAPRSTGTALGVHARQLAVCPTPTRRDAAGCRSVRAAVTILCAFCRGVLCDVRRGSPPRARLLRR